MKRRKDNLKDLNIRFATESDSELLLDFIKRLAAYEKKSDQVVATVNDIKKALFENRFAEAIIAYYKNAPIGFAVFFHNLSSFLGKSVIYIEDLSPSQSIGEENGIPCRYIGYRDSLGYPLL